MVVRDDIRNVAVIAHVDHGKTTLVDAMLRQARFFADHQKVRERFMDDGDLERERGITILAKNISFQYGERTINLVDTPGHSDFGGEVERTLRLADGVLLLVDAAEGPMPQTRFVLRHALALGLSVVVVINKIDRPDARPGEVLEMVLDLFLQLDANDDQLEFAVLYGSGRDGYMRRELEDDSNDLRPLFDAIIQHLPGPTVEPDSPLRMLITTLHHDQFVGRLGVGRVFAGVVHDRARVALMKPDGRRVDTQVGELFAFRGLERRKVPEVHAGDICAIAGLDGVDISDTVSDFHQPCALESIAIEQPTLSVVFYVNDSPFAGKEGAYVTSRKLRERLYRELQSNVALRVEDTDRGDAFKVSGRGLLHLGILIEEMRREGYEFAIGKPEVILLEVDGKKHEPIEIVVVDVPDQLSGKVIEIFGKRRGEITEMSSRNGSTYIEMKVPSRALLGTRTRVLTATAGEAVMHHQFLEYGPHRGDVPVRPRGAIVSMIDGEVVAYALDALKDRGTLFVNVGDKVYEGMIVGGHCKAGDISVNPCRQKHLTNIRASGADRALATVVPRRMTIEECLEFIEADELLEVTPKAWRMRKRLRKEHERKRERRSGAAAGRAGM